VKEIRYAIREYNGGYRIYVGGGKYRKAATKLRAEQIVAELKVARKIKGRELADLPVSLVAELKRQHDRAVDAGTTVEAALDHWLPLFETRKASIPLWDAVDKYLGGAEYRLAASTFIDHRTKLRKFREGRKEVTLAQAMEVKALTEYLDAIHSNTSERNWINNRLVLSAFANWCIPTLITDNPLRYIKLAEATPTDLDSNDDEEDDEGNQDEDGHIRVLSPGEAKVLLKAAVTHYEPDILAHIAIILFSGIRPHEFTKKLKPKVKGGKAVAGKQIFLKWENVDASRGILVSESLSKMSRRRLVPISDTLNKWIDFIRQREGVLEGPIIRSSGFYQRFKKWKKCLPKELPLIQKDIMRHSYGTYRTIVIRSAGEVAIEMGNSEQTIRDHYLDAGRSPAEAETYFGLTPEVVQRRGKGKDLKIA